MGLDITAYSNIRHVPDVTDQDRAYELGLTMLWRNNDFPHRADDIIDRGVYAYATMIDFRAGSYSGYNLWREELAKLAGYPALSDPRRDRSGPRHDVGAWNADSGPFWELINFSDCEGVIGATVAAKVLRDFVEFQPKADAHQGDWFRDRYALWRKAFELAANDGAVSFH